MLAAGFWGCGGDNATSPVAGDLTATCGASPTAGQAPLPVTFRLSVSGASGPYTTLVNYGDGVTSTDPSVPHVYQTAGAYNVAFSASQGSRSASCSTNVTVSAAPSSAVGGNQPPNAEFKTNPIDDGLGRITGKAPFTVNFNMCPSTDPDGDALLFTMDFNGDGKLEVNGTTGASCRRANTYAAGTYKAKICVTDMNSGGQQLHPFQCTVYTITATP
jgi:PKD repeat protein